MSEIHRRDVLRTGAVIAAASAVIVPSALVAKGAFGPSELAEIAELEKAVHDARLMHIVAIERHDAVYHDIGSAKAEADAAQTVACNDECTAEERLIEFPVTTIDGLAAKGLAMHRAVDWSCTQEAAGPALVRDIVRVAGGTHV